MNELSEMTDAELREFFLNAKLRATDPENIRYAPEVVQDAETEMADAAIEFAGRLLARGGN